MADWSYAEDQRPALCGEPQMIAGLKTWRLFVWMDWTHDGQSVKAYTRLAIWETARGDLYTQHGKVYPLIVEDDDAA